MTELHVFEQRPSAGWAAVYVFALALSGLGVMVLSRILGAGSGEEGFFLVVILIGCVLAVTWYFYEAWPRIIETRLPRLQAEAVLMAAEDSNLSASELALWASIAKKTGVAPETAEKLLTAFVRERQQVKRNGVANVASQIHQAQEAGHASRPVV